jgi:hypothetical protein
MVAETYIELMKNPAHLGAEATMALIENIVVGLALAPLARRWIRNHDEKKHKNDCNH